MVGFYSFTKIPIRDVTRPLNITQILSVKIIDHIITCFCYYYVFTTKTIYLL